MERAAGSIQDFFNVSPSTESNLKNRNRTNFLCSPYLDKEKRHQYWQAKQEWRRGLLTTEM